MNQFELLKRIDRLEKRVKELESRELPTVSKETIYPIIREILLSGYGITVLPSDVKLTVMIESNLR